MKIQFEIIIDDKIIALCRKIFKIKTIVFLIAASIFTTGLFIFAGEFNVVYPFEPNQVISSSQVNQNFRDLADRTLESINNVDAEGATTGKILKYNEVTSNWELADDDGGVAGSSYWTQNGSDIYYNIGNVGIGTINPTEKLTITNGDDAKIKLYTNGGSVGIIDSVANTSESIGRWLCINPTGGNVGIGTTEPSEKLEVAGNIIANEVTTIAGFFQARENLTAYDFTQATLDLTVALHILDLSTIVPEGTKAVLLGVVIVHTSAGNNIYFQKYGANGYNIAYIHSMVANTPASEDIIVACDENRFIQYHPNVASGWTLVQITVRGWWK